MYHHQNRISLLNFLWLCLDCSLLVYGVFLGMGEEEVTLFYIEINHKSLTCLIKMISQITYTIMNYNVSFSRWHDSFFLKTFHFLRFGRSKFILSTDFATWDNFGNCPLEFPNLYFSLKYFFSSKQPPIIANSFSYLSSSLIINACFYQKVKKIYVKSLYSSLLKSVRGNLH